MHSLDRNIRMSLHGMFLMLACLPLALSAAEPRYIPRATLVTDNVYAIIGPLGQRSELNDGLNNNFGFVVGQDGVILIDSGASRLGAQSIERAVAAVTPLPVKWVVNTGSQDHRWLGNDYFADRGAEVIALARTAQTQRQYAAQQLESLRGFLGMRFEGTQPHTADGTLNGETASLERGGVRLELRYTDAHYPGDAWVWLPQQSVLFSGDLVYVDRVFAVLPWSSVSKGREAYRAMEALAPEFIVPGHGRVTDIAGARGDCGDYYDFLVDTIGEAARDMEPMDEVLDRYSELPEFGHLEHFHDLHRANMNRTYLEFEQM
jgi:glyoxylase-like metal-dependent hydrolase (beta-lactamase superfamily II)